MTRVALLVVLALLVAAFAWFLWTTGPAVPLDPLEPSASPGVVGTGDRTETDDASEPAAPSDLPSAPVSTGPDPRAPERLVPEGIEVGRRPPSLEALVPAAGALPAFLKPVRGMTVPMLIEGGQARDLAAFYLGGFGCPGLPHEARRVALGSYLELERPVDDTGVLACEFDDEQAAFEVAVALRQSPCRQDGLESGADRVFLAGNFVVLTWRDGDVSPAAGDALVAHVRRTLSLTD